MPLLFAIVLSVITLGFATPFAHAAGCASGSLIKGASYAAVYYCAEDGKRYVFPNEKTYFTWYADFASVQTISDESLASISIGANVTYRPGARLIKITTDPRVYGVGANGTLRWIQAEELARQFYGADWATRVDDISDAYFVNYRVGAPVASSNDYDPGREYALTYTINLNLRPASPAPSPTPTPAPQPTPAPSPVPTVRPGSFRDALTYTFPSKVYRVGLWEINITPDLVFKGQPLRIIVTTSDFEKRGRITALTGTLVQLNVNPATGLGRADDIVFRNDGTMGDEHGNDAWFTATVPSESWYDLVFLNQLTVRYQDGTVEEVRPDQATFMIYRMASNAASVFESDHGVGVAPAEYSSAAQAYAQGVDLCYPSLVAQTGATTWRNGKAFYDFQVRAGYLEQGGLMNKVFFSDIDYRAINPSAPEWSSCNTITAHELTHSFFPDVAKPLWAEEGLAEYTARKALDLSLDCRADGWYEDGIRYAYTPLSSVTISRDYYMTSACVYRYIEDTYGASAIQTIYASLRNAQANGLSSACGGNKRQAFVSQVLVGNTGSSLPTQLQSRFGISSEDFNCSNP